MSDYKKYIIVKHVDLPPEDKYQGLSRDNEYEHLNTLEPLGVPMGEVPMTEEEAEFVLGLPQVKSVEEVKTFSVPEPKQDADVQGGADLNFHNIPAVHQKGFKGKGVKVAVLDTGLDNTHKNRIGSQLEGIADFTGSMSGTDDRQGHGTHCAGVVVQCAPEVSLFVAKVLGDNGSGTTSGIIKGINWAVSNNVHVISQSLGLFPDDPLTDSLSIAVNAARDKGVLMPCAAGNEQDDNPGVECADQSTPAAAARAICVAAVDRMGRRASFSNIGDAVDIAAVGVDVVSWGLRGSFNAVMSGTSMATPHVAGILALEFSAASGPDRVELALYKGSRNTGLSIKEEGHGVADALNSVNLLLGEVPTKPEPELSRLSLYRLDEERGDLLTQDWQLTVGSGSSRKDIGIYRGKA